MNLLDEFITKLFMTSNSCEVLSDLETGKISMDFFKKFPLNWGRIDWNVINNKKIISDMQDIFCELKLNKKDTQEPIYIIWGDANLPSVKCILADVLANIDMAVFLGGTALWLYNPIQKWVVEFYHDGDITIGFEN